MVILVMPMDTQTTSSFVIAVIDSLKNPSIILQK